MPPQLRDGCPTGSYDATCRVLCVDRAGIMETHANFIHTREIGSTANSNSRLAPQTGPPHALVTSLRTPSAGTTPTMRLRVHGAAAAGACAMSSAPALDFVCLLRQVAACMQEERRGVRACERKQQSEARVGACCALPAAGQLGSLRVVCGAAASAARSPCMPWQKTKHEL